MSFLFPFFCVLTFNKVVSNLMPQCLPELAIIAGKAFANHLSLIFAFLFSFPITLFVLQLKKTFYNLLKFQSIFILSR